MADWIPAGGLIWVFVAASVVIAVTPGPGVVYIVTRSLSAGRTEGFASVAGVAAGNFCNAVIAALGLAAVLATSAVAFTTIKFAGAAYLIWLGIQAWRRSEVSAPQTVVHRGLRRVFVDGYLVALLNPKTALFFAAFLPQFMAGPVSPFLQAPALAAAFVAIAAVTDTLYVLTATGFAGRMTRSSTPMRIGRRMTGGVYIGLGAMAAIGGRYE